MAQAPNFKLTSAAFKDSEPIPLNNTQSGDNHSPELSWQGVPAGARELALIVEDPDAPGGDFVHWIVYGIPTTLTEFSEGLPTETLPDGKVAFAQGRNDMGRTGYAGPAPPPGKVHHYHFRLMALDAPLNLPLNADKGSFRAALKGHVMAEADLIGTFEKR